MENSNYFANLISQISKRSIESTVSILGISNKNLREHIVAELQGDKIQSNFIADPVFESMFPWEKSDVVMDDLAGNLLTPSLVDAMDRAKEHRFNRNWNPFRHQIFAWQTLLETDKKSVVVTSGTGSGKTECFMVPILNELAKEYENKGSPLVGVRALFLYPLNALINSQRERLRAWTDYYNDGIRFCLYNGNTRENKHNDQGKYPNEILTRKTLRDQPSPILVTNATMLEYMLVRQIDEPIIAKSSGKLKWIVLDEAHTYLGSQAAEISLLLRRVLHTFGVAASNVRFIATSATIGDSRADEQLKNYLANLAGINSEQVVVIGGQRSIPLLKNYPPISSSVEQIASIESSQKHSNERFKALCKSRQARKLREELTSSKTPKTLSFLSKTIFGDESRTSETLNWLDLCSSTEGSCDAVSENGPFLPLRGHLFHQVLSGLWCCVDKNCKDKSSTKLKENWQFGRVFIQRRTSCTCGSPVYELAFCTDCNSPHLLAQEYLDNEDSTYKYIQTEHESLDEFSLDFEQPEDSDSESSVENIRNQIVISPSVHDELTYSVSLNQERQIVPPGMETIDINVIQNKDHACGHCGYPGYRSHFYRRCLLGTPFYISNTVPTLLESCQESEEANNRPYRGRRLITFTDSRQGTARISTKIQQDAERDTVRGIIYASAANNISKITQKEYEDKIKEIAKCESNVKKLRESGFDDMAIDYENKAINLKYELESQGNIKTLSWDEIVSQFQSSPDISTWILDYYKNINPQLFGENGGIKNLIEILLIREFARRPKRQNSMETLGLVSVQYPVLNSINNTPKAWNELGLTTQDWRDFLKITLDFYVRENSMLNIPNEWINWIGAKVYPKYAIKPGSDESTTSRIFRWPQVIKGRNNRLIRLLISACKIDINNNKNIDILNAVLVEAWNALTKRYSVSNTILEQNEERQILKNVPGTVQFQMDKKEMAFKACTDLWICPITHRLFDTTFKGITPYLPLNASNQNINCAKTSTDIFQIDASQFNSERDRLKYIRQSIRQSSEVEVLRSENLWTDVCDRIVEGNRFFRTAEHSAQQPASVLEDYESKFKTGRLNVLSCSTTMEMGVDIGGISVVAMNNVPPHPANYLQRAGRAGRRGESQALAFTICKDNPHERAIFANPLWPFTTSIPAPNITLNCESIVQRHINAMLLAKFLKQILSIKSTQTTSLQCKWFFTSEPDIQAPVDNMICWISSNHVGPISPEISGGITKIVHGSILAAVPQKVILEKSIQSLNTAKNNWLPTFNKILELVKEASSLPETDPLRKKVEYDLRCVGEQYLLSELASMAFLPGYGFPSGLVTFDSYTASDFKKGKYVKPSGRIDNRARMRERPSRQMAVAIREYAPGSDVILDGLVYKSGGILINEFAPDEDFSQPQKLKKAWRCHNCGFIGNESGSTFTGICSDCGRDLKIENIREYIAPVGFTVDFYDSPTIDISTQKYIPVEEPWVTAKAPINPLFDPKLGVCRTGTEGSIFYHTSGEYGEGFAICLRCGRAESMLFSGQIPHIFQSSSSHDKLQGRKDKNGYQQCEGAQETYAIKAGVHLGATDQTDVFELYLKYPSENLFLRHRVGDPLSWTLAVVFRQALADIHGVDVSEIGYTVKTSMLPNCNYPASGIVLFDTNGGGAGFSSSATKHLKEIFSKSLKYLNCEDNCDCACQRCLLGYDTRFHSDTLNRHVAMEYLQSIQGYLELPQDLQIFGESTQHCLDPLNEEFLTAVNQGYNDLQIYLSGPYHDWDLSESNLKEQALSWKGYFSKVSLVLENSNLDELSVTQKEDIWVLNKLGIQICRLKTDKNKILKESGQVIAQLKGESSAITFGTDNILASIPGPHWHKINENYLLKSYSVPTLKIEKINTDFLSTSDAKNDVEIELSNECDGPLTLFGDHFWEQIYISSPTLGNLVKSDKLFSKIEYTDPYICNPWNLMLLFELFQALKNSLKDNWNNPELLLITGDKPANLDPIGLYSEWPTTQEKTTTIKGYFNHIGESINVHVRPRNDIAHGRILTLTWENGEKYTVRLDHGFGCWAIGNRPTKWFSISKPPEQQISDIISMRSDLKVKFNKKFATQVFIKSR